jgi:type I restriction-modification system DNA methylase subunit
MAKKKAQTNNTGANLGFEAKLWAAADALRNNMDAAEYKHVVLGLIFLKYISDAFEAKHAELEAQQAQGADPEDPDEYPRRQHLLGAEGSTLVASQGQCPAAHHRHDRGRCDDRDRA